MRPRNILHLLPATEVDMGRTTVRQAIPTQQVEQIDPFLLLHHFGPFEAEPGSDPLDVGPHPHRGFAPVTFLYSGGLRHRDSRGNTAHLEGGDIQWMISGMGIIHSERASQAFLENGGTMEGIQLWINLPAEHKMVQPYYQHIKGSVLPQVEVGEGIEARLVAGEFSNQQGPAKAYSELLIMQLTIEKGANLQLPIPPDYHAGLYLLDGRVSLPSGFSYEGPQLLHFAQHGDGIAVTGDAETTRALLISGRPINEPVASYGPFVMNSQTEIMEAMRDYQKGKMGFYIEE